MKTDDGDSPANLDRAKVGRRHHHQRHRHRHNRRHHCLVLFWNRIHDDLKYQVTCVVADCNLHRSHSCNCDSDDDENAVDDVDGDVGVGSVDKNTHVCTDFHVAIFLKNGDAVVIAIASEIEIESKNLIKTMTAIVFASHGAWIQGTTATLNANACDPQQQGFETYVCGQTNKQKKKLSLESHRCRRIKHESICIHSVLQRWVAEPQFCTGSSSPSMQPGL